MTRQKVLLIVAAGLFGGWLVYLAFAVWVHRTNPPDIVSRSQLAGAPYLVVAEVTVADGKPDPKVAVVHRLAGDGPADGSISVANLPDARPPSNGPFPGPGKYLLPLEPAGVEPGAYRVAGWPRSPAMPAIDPKDARHPESPFRPPLVYPWTDAVQKQMTNLGYRW